MLSAGSLRPQEVQVLLALQDKVKIGSRIVFSDVMTIVKELGLASTESSWTIMESLEREGYFGHITEEINEHRMYRRLPKFYPQTRGF